MGRGGIRSSVEIITHPTEEKRPMFCSVKFGTVQLIYVHSSESLQIYSGWRLNRGNITFTIQTNGSRSKERGIAFASETNSQTASVPTQAMSYWPAFVHL